MRITRESLIRIAKETAIQRVHDDKRLVAVYLTGSLLTENPFLGGTTDIDLVFVHEGEPPFRREIISLSPEIHLDIKHNPRSEYAQPRELRVDPWLGPEMYNPMLLHQSRHFFEFVQASIRDRYLEPANVLQRSRRNYDHARQIWTGMQQNQDTSPPGILSYLKAINHAANSIAVLNGPPLAERRFLLQFPARAEHTGHPEFSKGILNLLGAPNMDQPAMAACLPDWQTAFTQASRAPGADARLHPARLGYYRQALEAILAGENPQAALWPLIHTWTLAAAAMTESKRLAWQSVCARLGLTMENFPAQLKGLDLILDEIEQLLEDLASANGL